MLKLTGKVGRAVWLLIYGLFVVLLGIMIILSVTKPQHNLIPWQMAVGTVVGTGLLLAAFFLWDKLSLQKTKRTFFLSMALLLLFGILLYAASCLGRNDPASFVDYGRVWTGAMELSRSQELSEAWYFKLCANNFKPMLYLSVIFRISHFFSDGDPFYFALFLSVLEVLASVWGTTTLIDSFRKEGKVLGIPVLLLFVCTLPIWANVQAFYTDGMSFAVGIVVLAFLKLCFEADSKLKTGVYLLFAGGVLGTGITVKITVLIPVIAGLIVFCFLRPSARLWKIAGLFFICSLLAYEATNLWAQNFEVWIESKNTSKPIIHYVAQGMKGDGSWEANREYSASSDALPTKQEKVEYALRYINENRGNFIDLSHLVQKLRCNFASGSLGTKDYTYRSLKKNNPIWELFSPWGKYYWRTSQLCFCYLFSIYTCYLLGAILTVYNLLKKKAIPAIKAVADLALLGNMIFLMIWEANNRQLYNQVPVIILGGVMNILYIVEFFRGQKTA